MMAPGDPRGGNSGEEDKDAKNMFDRIGQQVYKEVEKEKVEKDAKKYIKELEGKLSLAKVSGVELAGSNDPCSPDYTTRFDANSNRYPCEKRSPVRFSDESRSQCTYNRIKDNEKVDNTCGACAPFRRLSVCDYNLEKMGRTSTTTNKLLLDVCLAAYYEAESLIPDHAQYVAKYGDSGSTICTVLARSFADIGDIIRGKDLFLGGPSQEKKKLEERLKTIFKKIHGGLSRTNGKNVDALKDRYKDDDPDYYQLREDWWTANRDQVWKAMTCDDDNKLASASYFHATCDGGDNRGGAQANNKCRCPMTSDGKPNDQVPTYFDYVPQYLR
ncbi:hypothetical protein PFMC_05951, partial [Plasmodium falciparum CAMP/Malaysia]